MKHTFTFLLLFTLFQSFAQTSNSAGGNVSSEIKTETGKFRQKDEVADKAARDEIFRKNIIKMNLSSLAFKNYSFSYERSIARKISLVAGVGFVPKTNTTSIPLVENAIENFIDEEDDIVEDLKRSSIANKTYTGEIRFYTGKKPGAQGFYLSLYGRYMDLDATYSHTYETDTRSYVIPIDGNLKGVGGGLMIGSQWLIGKRVSFDWYILGGHYGKTKLNLFGMTDLSTMTTEERRELERDIESVNEDIPGNSQVDATVTDKGVFVKGNTPFAGIRGLGFSFGIAF